MVKLLVKLRLLDEDGNLSLTHLAVYLAFFCMVRGVAVSWTEMGAFVVAMASYRVKRALEDGAPDGDHLTRLAAVEDTVKKLGSPERLLALRDQLGGPRGQPR